MGSQEILNAVDAMKLRDYTGACNEMAGEHYVSAEGYDFTYEDIMALQDAYYSGEGTRHIHMSDVTGRICWKSLGEIENRKLADKIADTCEGILTGEGAVQKCDAVYEAVDAYAEQPWWESTFKWLGISAAGLAGTWAVFGPGMTLWHKISNAGSRAAGLPLMIMELVWPKEVFESAIRNSPSNRYGHNYSSGA